MNRFVSVLVTATAAIMATAAAAEVTVLSPGTDTFAQVAQEGPWTIYADGNRQSCLIEGVDIAGNVVQMGLTSDHKLGYVGVFTPVDVGLTDGGDKAITIEVNGNTYSGEVKTREHGLAEGYQGGYFLTDNPQFVEDMMAGTEMVAFANDTGNGVVIDLTGSHTAIEAASTCTRQLIAM